MHIPFQLHSEFSPSFLWRRGEWEDPVRLLVAFPILHCWLPVKYWQECSYSMNIHQWAEMASNHQRGEFYRLMKAKRYKKWNVSIKLWKRPSKNERSKRLDFWVFYLVPRFIRWGRSFLLALLSSFRGHTHINLNTS